MVIKSLIKKNDGFLKLSFFSLIFFITMSTLSQINCYALNNVKLMFNDSNKIQRLGNFKNPHITFSVSLARGCNDYVVFIKDSKGGILAQGMEGEFDTSEPVYVEVRGSFDSDWRLDVVFNESLDSSNVPSDDNVKGNNNGGCCPNLTFIERMLKHIGEVLDKIEKNLGLLLSYLSNQEHLKKGIDNLKNSLDNLNSKVTPKDNVISSLSNLGQDSSGSLDTDMTVTFAPGVVFNTFDLSSVVGLLGSIRSLLKAIIWIEFAVFSIRVVAPKFKV